jgi:hypothetical protein
MAAAFEGAQPIALSDRRAVIAIIASTVGFSLDMFDLFILLYVAPAVGKAFFPSDSPTLSVAAVYASFAVTLLMRPVGSTLFGNYADRRGRKGAMIIAVIGVGLATAAFGVLPTLAQIDASRRSMPPESRACPRWVLPPTAAETVASLKPSRASRMWRHFFESGADLHHGSNMAFHRARGSNSDASGENARSFR